MDPELAKKSNGYYWVNWQKRNTEDEVLSQC